MLKTVQEEITPYYPFLLVKPVYAKRVSEFGIEVQDKEPEVVPAEVEVVAFPEEFDQDSGEGELSTFVGEHIYIKDVDSPLLRNGTYFVHKDKVMGFKPEPEE